MFFFCIIKMSIIQSQNSSNLQNLTYAQIQRLGNRNIPNINAPINITRTGVRNFDNYNRQHLQAPVQNNINYTNIGQNSNQNISQNLNQNINQNSNQCQLPVSQVDYFRDILVTRSQPQVIAEEVNDCDGSVKIQRQKISVNYQATPWSIDPSFQVQPEYSTLVPRTIFNR